MVISTQEAIPAKTTDYPSSRSQRPDTSESF